MANYQKQYLQTQLPEEMVKGREEKRPAAYDSLSYLDRPYRERPYAPGGSQYDSDMRRFDRSPLENRRDMLTQGYENGLGNFNPKGLNMFGDQVYGQNAAFNQSDPDAKFMQRAFNGGVVAPQPGWGTYGGTGALGLMNARPTYYWPEYPFQDQNTDMYRYWESLYGN